jgi:hypothetical protein
VGTNSVGCGRAGLARARVREGGSDCWSASSEPFGEVSGLGSGEKAKKEHPKRPRTRTAK